MDIANQRVPGYRAKLDWSFPRGCRRVLWGVVCLALLCWFHEVATAEVLSGAHPLKDCGEQRAFQVQFPQPAVGAGNWVADFMVLVCLAMSLLACSLLVITIFGGLTALLLPSRPSWRQFGAAASIVFLVPMSLSLFFASVEKSREFEVLRQKVIASDIRQGCEHPGEHSGIDSDRPFYARKGEGCGCVFNGDGYSCLGNFDQDFDYWFFALFGFFVLFFLCLPFTSVFGLCLVSVPPRHVGILFAVMQLSVLLCPSSWYTYWVMPFGPWGNVSNPFGSSLPFGVQLFVYCLPGIGFLLGVVLARLKRWVAFGHIRHLNGEGADG